MTTPLRFHLAIPVHDLASTRAFYGGVLGCPEARGHDDSLTFDFFGHQLVCHVVPSEAARNIALHRMGDDDVPPRHFGALFDWDEWPRRVAGLRAGCRTGATEKVFPEQHRTPCPVRGGSLSQRVDHFAGGTSGKGGPVPMLTGAG